MKTDSIILKNKKVKAYKFKLNRIHVINCNVSWYFASPCPFITNHRIQLANESQAVFKVKIDCFKGHNKCQQ